MNLLPLLCLIAAFAVSYLTPQALSDDSHYEACAPRKCTDNGTEISYPFWISGQHPSYCGQPSFEILCKDDRPFLSIPGNNFSAKNIFYSNNSLLLVDEIAYESSCGTPLSNVSLDGTPFDLVSGNYKLYFFYNCTTQPSLDYFYNFTCDTDPSLFSFAYFYEEVSNYVNYSGSYSSGGYSSGGYSSGGYSSGGYSSGGYTCQSVIRAPMDVQVNASTWTKMSAIDLVRMGFLVNWTADNCTMCVDSGGRCGYDNNELVCFCPDGLHPKTCRNGIHGRKLGMKIGIGVGTGIGFVAMMSIVFFVVYTRRRKNYAQTSVVSRSISSMYSSQTDFGKGSFSYGVPIFDYEELEKATNNFDRATQLGNGGFGTVFKGKLRDGRVVAVKRLYEHNFSGIEQFVNEVEILARLRHPNLISLYGCTSRKSSRLLLVYEYIPNGTVSDHIHGTLAKPGLPPWLTRLNIAIETASALVYLHASDVIHRDLKTKNILLDENFNVKVADFGLSRLFPLDVTHISTAPQGTPGYVDPEYHQCYQLTEKSDVYSFGVVLIELISSLPAVDIMRRRHEINLSALAINKIQANALNELVDANLGFESDDRTREMITAVAELAFRCLQPRHNDRPSMQEVLQTLKRTRKCGCGYENAEEGDDPSDDAALLNNDSRTFSPDSVIVKWDGRSSVSVTPNVSA